MRDQQHRKYPEEFELEALRRLATSGKSAAQSEREPGITEGMLLKQRERYQVIQPEEGQASLEPSDNERSPNCSKKQRSAIWAPFQVDRWACATSDIRKPSCSQINYYKGQWLIGVRKANFRLSGDHAAAYCANTYDVITTEIMIEFWYILGKMITAIS